MTLAALVDTRARGGRGELGHHAAEGSFGERFRATPRPLISRRFSEVYSRTARGCRCPGSPEPMRGSERVRPWWWRTPQDSPC